MKLLAGHQLSVALGGESILRELSFGLNTSEMLGLIGPNGAGKTTLLRILAGLITPDNGKVTVDDVAYAGIDPQVRARRISYLAQSGTAHWPMSVERIVALGRLPHLSDWQRPTARDDEIIHRVMAQTDVLQFKERRFNTLSGGERARVLFARALVAEPEILLADEPVAALDLAHQLEVMSLLRGFCEQGGAVVVVLHDLRLAAHYCHRLLLLEQGRTVADGLPEAVLNEANMQQVFGVRMREDAGSMPSAFNLPWQKA